MLLIVRAMGETSMVEPLLLGTSLFSPACCCGFWLIPTTTTVEVAYASRFLCPSPCAISNAEENKILFFNPPLQRGIFYVDAWPSGSSVTLAPSLNVRRQRVWGGCS